MDNTVLLFSTSIFEKVAPGVNAGWTAMRDIANIVIIGMFTFIAISTILSIEEYGARKLLARVLVIAVLINFSLLFTKMIIDASNFTAGQFYASASGVPLGTARDDARKHNAGQSPVPATADAVDSGTSFRNIGFSGAFLNFMKITSVSDTFSRLYAKAQDQGGWSALAHGILSAAVLLGAAAVLFYGAYLLLSRAVLFIFLMVTAAGAFATYLIPGMNDSTYGWKGWWSSLLHNAALAPILLILLWITVTISSKMTAMNGGTLGGLASTQPPSSPDVGVLFSYFIILGLLFGSFKLASKWAGKVGGLNFTGTMLKTAAVGTAAVASRFVAAPIMRQTVGRLATGRSVALLNKVRDQVGHVEEMRKLHGEKSDEYKAARQKLRSMQLQKRVVDVAAGGSYNIGNLGVAKAGVGMLKVPGLVSGQVAQKKPQGFKGAMDELVKKRMAEAEALVRKPKEVEDTLMAKLENSSEHLKKIAGIRQNLADAENAVGAVNQTRVSQMPGLNNERKAANIANTNAEDNLNALKRERGDKEPILKELMAQDQQVKTVLTDTQQKQITIGSTATAEVNRLDTIINSAAANKDEKDQARRDKVEVEKQRDAAMNEQTQKITEATATAADIQRRISGIQTLDAKIQGAEVDAKKTKTELDMVNGKIENLDRLVKEADAGLEEAKGAEESYMNEKVREIQENARAIVKASGRVAEDYAVTRVHRRWTNIIPRVVLRQEEENDTASIAMRKAAKAGIRDIGLKDQMKAWAAAQRDIGGGAGGAAPAPSVQATGGGAAGGTGTP